MFIRKKIIIFFGLILIFIFSLFQADSNVARASFYDGRENYLGFGIDAVQANSISQDSIETSARIFKADFLKDQPHIPLVARYATFNQTSGFSSTDFMNNFNLKADYYQSVSGQKGAFSYGESINLKTSASVNYSSYNSVYFNRTSYVYDLGGYSLEYCTTDPILYSSQVTSSFQYNFDNLPSSYSTSNKAQFVDFFQTYGTHIVCKAYYGGKVDVYKTVTSSKVNFDSDIQTELNKYFGGEYKDYVAGSSNETYSIANKTSLETNDYSEYTKITAIGGAYFLDVHNDLKVLHDNIIKWKDTINLGNADLIDFGQGSLYPIYKLVRPLNYKKSLALEEAYNDYLATHYSSALNYIKTGTPFLSNEVDVFDGVHKITDDGRWKSPHVNIYFNDLNIDLATLKQLGYTTCDITLKLHMWEENAGYQSLYIYDSYAEDGTAKKLKGIEDYQYYGIVTNLHPTTVTFKFQDIPINSLIHNYFTFRARASGNLDDDWKYDDIHAKVQFFKQS